MVDKITLSHLAYTLLKPQPQSNDEPNFIASTEDIKVRLKFISHIQKDQKIDTKNLRLQNNGYFCSFYRFIFPDNRMNTIRFIKDVVHRTFEIIELYKLSKRCMDLKLLLEDLLKATTGLNNLKATYESDTLFVCHIDSVIESIKVRLSSMNISSDEMDETDSKTESPKSMSISSEENPPPLESLP